MRLAIAAFLLTLTVPALAQQQQVTPSQAALQITGVIGQMATAIENCGVENQKLQAQIAELKKEVDSLKAAKPKK